MAALEDVFGSSHNIGTAGIVNGYISDIRMAIPTEVRLHDLSGISFRESDTRLQEFSFDSCATDADTLVYKFKAYKMAYEMNVTSIQELHKTINNIETHKADYLRERNSYHNILLTLGPFPDQKDFDVFMNQKNELHQLEETMREHVLNKLTSSLQKTEKELEMNLLNMNKFREFVRLGIKSLIPEGEIKQNFCPICIEKEINKCVVPCGHTFCDGCIKKSITSVSQSSSLLTTHKGICPTCRSKIESVINFYLS